ncbi:hypothetical protein Bca101_022667 [Brassica carinata]
MGDSSPEYDPEYARMAAEVRAELKELAEDESYFFSDDDPGGPQASALDLHSTVTIFRRAQLTIFADRSPITFETCVKHIDDQVTFVPNLWWETQICRVEGSDEADYEWNDGAVNDYYKGEMPKWLSDNPSAALLCGILFCVTSSSRLNNQSFMTEKNGWLPLLTEFAFFTKWNGPLSPAEIEDCRPLITQRVVVETHGEGEKEPSDKLNAANAIFYISFECVEDPTIGHYRAVVRKTMDGKPGHMRLEVTCSKV